MTSSIAGTISSGSANTGQGAFLSMRDVARALRRGWWMVGAAMAAAFVLAIVLVRSSMPIYEASMTMVKAQQTSAAASIWGQFTGGGADSSSLDELRATIFSRPLSEALAADPVMQRFLARYAARPRITGMGRLRRNVAAALFGPRPVATDTPVDRLRDALSRQITVEWQNTNVVVAKMRDPDPVASELVLRLAVSEAQRMMAARQRLRAQGYRQYLAGLLAPGANVASNQVTQQMLVSAIGDTLRLSNPSAQTFVTIDDARASRTPVSPRAGLTLAVCLAAGFALGASFVLVRRIAA